MKQLLIISFITIAISSACSGPTEQENNTKKREDSITKANQWNEAAVNIPYLVVQLQASIPDSLYATDYTYMEEYKPIITTDTTKIRNLDHPVIYFYKMIHALEKNPIWRKYDWYRETLVTSWSDSKTAWMMLEFLLAYDESKLDASWKVKRSKWIDACEKLLGDGYYKKEAQKCLQELRAKKI